MKQEQPSPAQQRQERVTLAAIGLIAVVIIGGGGFWAVSNMQAATSQRKRIEQRQQANTQLSLPIDYPSDVLPIYDGVEIASSERGEVKSTDGEPMDQWKVHGETDEDKQKLYDYYNNLLLGQGMSQTMYASVPSGYGVTYSNERTEIQLTIERKKSDKRTQLDITFSRLRNAPKPAAQR